MSESLFSSDTHSSDVKLYSRVDFEKRLSQIDTERQMQKKIREEYLIDRFFVQDTLCTMNHFHQEIDLVSKSVIEETLLMSEFNSSIEKIKLFLEEQEAHQTSNTTQQEFRAILPDIRTLISAVEDLSYKVKALEKELNYSQSTVKKKANNFALDVRDDISLIEQECVELHGVKPSLRNIARFLNEKNIPSPAGNGVWHNNTVRLVKERIKHLEQDANHGISR